MKKVPGKYFWLLMTITGALMFGAPALVSASEGIASTDTENSAADNAADTPDDDTIAKTTDSAEKNSVVHLDTSGGDNCRFRLDHIENEWYGIKHIKVDGTDRFADVDGKSKNNGAVLLSLIHISEPTRP